jgi:hypothetical protein
MTAEQLFKAVLGELFAPFGRLPPVQRKRAVEKAVAAMKASPPDDPTTVLIRAFYDQMSNEVQNQFLDRVEALLHEHKTEPSRETD